MLGNRSLLSVPNDSVVDFPVTVRVMISEHGKDYASLESSVIQHFFCS